MHLDNGESSSAAARRNTATNTHAPAAASSPPAAPAGESSTPAPGFLQSLLQEVEVDRFAERDKVGQYSFDPAVLPGNVENFMGVAQVPIGLAAAGSHIALSALVVPLAQRTRRLAAPHFPTLPRLSCNAWSQPF